MKYPNCLLIPLLCASLLSACGGGSSSISPADGNTGSGTGGDGNNGGAGVPGGDGSNALRPAASAETLEEFLKASLLSRYGELQQNIAYPELADDGMTQATPTTAASSAASDSGGSAGGTTTFSTTNLQESDVDEADRLKNTATHIYTSTQDGSGIRIYAAQDNNAPLVGSLDITEQLASGDYAAFSPLPPAYNPGIRLSGLYLRADANQLLGIAGGSSADVDIWGNWFAPSYWQGRKTSVLDIDIADPADPSETLRIELDGQLISSRRVDSTLYLALRSSPSITGLDSYPTTDERVTQNKSLIDAAELSSLMPAYKISGSSVGSGQLYAPENCYFSDYTERRDSLQSIIGVVAIDLDAPASTPRGSCFIGDAEAIYASSKSMYLATTRYNYSTSGDAVLYDNPAPTTELHKFSLADGVTTYKGSGSVEGHLGWQQGSKSFRMSEYEDVLRIITYSGRQSAVDSSPALLHTLKEEGGELKVLAKLPNTERPAPLGKPGEQIYATRFIGKRGYLVTFRAVDPLYVLDLSDPADPVVSGELEINGYSDYLHPIGDRYLLGIGKDAVPATTVADGGRGAWYQGVKLSLIDVTDPATPSEKSKIIIGGRGSETAVSRTHHALTALQQGNAIELAMPMRVHETVSGDGYAITDPRYWFSWTRDELYRLSIDVTTGSVEELPAVASPVGDSPYSGNYAYDRSTIIGDRVYYLAGDQIAVAAR